MPTIYLPIIIVSSLLIIVIYNFSFYNLKTKNKNLILLLFIIHSIFTLLNLYFSTYFYSSDTVFYNSEALRNCISLQKNPKLFLHDFIFDWGGNPDTFNFLSRASRFWEQLGLGIERRLLLIFNLISLGNPYAVAILYSFISFSGKILIYKSLDYFFLNKKLGILLILFCIPSISFWSSGINKEGLLLFSIGLILWNTILWLYEKKSFRLFYILLGIVLLFCVRNFVFISFFPLYILWILLYKNVTNAWKYFLFISLTILSYFLFSSLLPKSNFLNIYDKIAERQIEFINIHRANLVYNIPLIRDNISNFFKACAISLNNVFIRPYFFESTSTVQKLASIENIILCIGFISLSFYTKIKIIKKPFLLMLLIFSIANLVFIGITVPYGGAINRYRVSFLLILWLVLIVSVRIKKNNFIDNQQ